MKWLTISTRDKKGKRSIHLVPRGTRGRRIRSDWVRENPQTT